MIKRVVNSRILAVAVVLCCAGCDSTTPETEEDPIVSTVEEVALGDQLIGLWERDVGTTEIGLLFKVGGVFQVGEPRPFFPVIGTWELQGDTLQMVDPGCLDRGFYRIEIEEAELTVSALDESCGGRQATLDGTWRRFVYGQ